VSSMHAHYTCPVVSVLPCSVNAFCAVTSLWESFIAPSATTNSVLVNWKGLMLWDTFIVPLGKTGSHYRLAVLRPKEKVLYVFDSIPNDSEQACRVMGGQLLE
jgi:hypothetical protein